MKTIAKLILLSALAIGGCASPPLLEPQLVRTFEFGPDTDGDTMTLYDAPCMLEIPDAESYMAATAVVTGKAYTGCWAASPPVVLLKWDNGRGGYMPIMALRVGELKAPPTLVGGKRKPIPKPVQMPAPSAGKHVEL